MKRPITESREWQKLQAFLGEKTHFVSADNFHYLAIEKSTPVGNYLFLPYGPVFKGEEGLKTALKSLTELANTLKSIFIRIEPQEKAVFEAFLERHRSLFTKVKDIDPADTWVLDLTPDEGTIKSGFSQGTRTRYNNYAKKGLTVEVTRDPKYLEALFALQHRLYEKKHLSTFSDDYLRAELAQPFASLYLVRYNKSCDKTASDGQNLPEDGQVLAASLFFDYAGTRYYMQSAADQDYKRLPATVALLTSSIFDAKEKGIKEFDFWGIAPDGAPKDHPWAGFTEFKKSFGGAPQHYAGTYDLIVRRGRYRLYTILRKIRRFL